MNYQDYFEDRDSETLTMADTVIEFLKENSLITALYADLEAAKVQLIADEAAIVDEAVRRGTLKQSNQGVKDGERDQVATSCFVAQKALAALGKKSNIAELNNMTKYYLSKMEKMRYVLLKNHCLMIIALLDKYILQLTDGTYTPADLQAFKDLVEEYKSKLSTVDTQNKLGVESGTELDLKFDKLMATIHLIDNHVDSLLLKQPVFNRQYKEMRKRHSYGTRHKEQANNPPVNPENPQ